MQFGRIFAATDASSRKSSGAANDRTADATIRARVKDASNAPRIVDRFGARAVDEAAIFTNSKPRPGFYHSGESPLSGAVACWRQINGGHLGGCSTQGETRPMRVLDRPC